MWQFDFWRNFDSFWTNKGSTLNTKVVELTKVPHRNHLMISNNWKVSSINNNRYLQATFWATHYPRVPILYLISKRGTRGYCWPLGFKHGKPNNYYRQFPPCSFPQLTFISTQYFYQENLLWYNRAPSNPLLLLFQIPAWTIKNPVHPWPPGGHVMISRHINIWMKTARNLAIYAMQVRKTLKF